MPEDITLLARMPQNHHFISPDAVQLGARHGVNSN